MKQSNIVRTSLVLVFGFCILATKGDLTAIVDVCCTLGTDWSSQNDRCDDFRGEMPDLLIDEEMTCRSVIEVCCLKSKQDEMCSKGVTDAQDGGRCAVRWDKIGAVSYTECCQCCQMGRSVKQMGMPCSLPSIGNPCDVTFMECCRDKPVDAITTETPDNSGGSANNYTEFDECKMFGATDLCSQICIDTPDSYRCDCHQGFRLAGDGKTCYRDSNSNNNNNRPRDCPSGLAYNTITGQCDDIDECVIGTHNCQLSANEVCHNRRGSFYCSCDDGFHRNRTTQRCDDIDECARRMDTCTASQRCENTVGSFACRRITPCGTGWTLNEETQQCIDQNECEADTHNCGTGYECFNIEGSFRCNPKRCPDGQRFNSGTGQCEEVGCPNGFRADSSALCVDIDECSRNPCEEFQVCQNTYGSYRCVDNVNCRQGFRVDSDGVTCVDIDECATGKHDCHSGAECINRLGSYVCSCPSGFTRVRGRCEDKDECQYRNVCPSNSVCENTRGSFRCNCDPGFEQTGPQRCTDINECSDRNLCTQGCTNLVGSYVCTCEPGYKLAADGHTCLDIDECRVFSGPGVCAGECINTPGSYRCSCPNGWRIMGNDRSCQDINECLERTDRCGTSDDVMCFNTRGSHKCPRVSCPSGFSRSALGPRRNSDVEVESDAILCKKFCYPSDTQCQHNETTSVSYQFFSLPTIKDIKRPAALINITAEGFILIPQMFLHIVNGNEEDLFDTKVEGDIATFRIVRPIYGPREMQIMLRLENRSYIGNKLLSAHNAHVHIYVSGDEF